jgi:hypothetical protein
MINYNNCVNPENDEFEQLKEKWIQIRKFEQLKEKWRIIREEKKKTMIEMKTPLDELLKIIEKYEEISLKDLQNILKVPMKLIEDWLLMLEKKEMVKLHYSLLDIKVKTNGKVRNQNN